MLWVLGVDGCRAGWIGAALAFSGDARLVDFEWLLFPDFAALLVQRQRFAQIAIDMPIGLLDECTPGGRLCDKLARKAISPRTSSVFSPPPRPALAATDYDQARPFGLSLQAFHIMPKIRQIDALITPELQQHIFEAHPELAFTLLSGSPMQHNKLRHAGRAERVHALTSIFPDTQSWLDALPFKRSQVGLDDAIDALILAHVARRKVDGEALCLPDDPGRDARGLEMAIWG